MILLVGLAVGVDYALFYMRRERDERRAGRSAEGAALQAAAATSGRAVLISGITVMIAMAGMFFSGDKTFMSFAIGAMLVVFVAMIGSLTVLPAVLSALGDRIEKGRIPFLGRRRRARSAEGSRFWGAILRPVLRHPVIATVASAAVLVALALPALQLHTAQSGLDAMPKSQPELQAFHKLEESFPGGATAAVVAVRSDDPAGTRAAIARHEARGARHRRDAQADRRRAQRRRVHLPGRASRWPARAPTGSPTTPWRPCATRSCRPPSAPSPAPSTPSPAAPRSRTTSPR